MIRSWSLFHNNKSGGIIMMSPTTSATSTNTSRTTATSSTTVNNDNEDDDDDVDDKLSSRRLNITKTYYEEDDVVVQKKKVSETTTLSGLQPPISDDPIPFDPPKFTSAIIQDSVQVIHGDSSNNIQLWNGVLIPKYNNNTYADCTQDTDDSSNMVAYGPRRRLQKAIYGSVWLYMKLIPATSATSKSKSSNNVTIIWKTTTESVAIKIVSRDILNELTDGGRRQLSEDPIKEMAAMQYISNNNCNSNNSYSYLLGCVDILKIINHDESSSSTTKSNDTTNGNGNDIYCIMPYCRGGDLLNVLNSFSQEQQGHNNGGRIPEDIAKYYFKQLLSGLKQLRSIGLCHRDLSLENVLLVDNIDMNININTTPTTTNSLLPKIKIMDMGMCLRVPYYHVIKNNKDNNNDNEGQKQQQSCQPVLIKPQGTCGKFPYMSPEIFHSTQPFDGYAIDLWCVGCILHYMVIGHLPYKIPRDNDPRFKSLCLNGNLKQNLIDWNISSLSDSVIDLLQKMLLKNPYKRLTLDEVMNHPWVTSNSNSTSTTTGSSSSHHEEEEKEEDKEKEEFLCFRSSLLSSSVVNDNRDGIYYNPKTTLRGIIKPCYEQKEIIVVRRKKKQEELTTRIMIDRFLINSSCDDDDDGSNNSKEESSCNDFLNEEKEDDDQEEEEEEEIISKNIIMAEDGGTHAFQKLPQLGIRPIINNNNYNGSFSYGRIFHKTKDDDNNKFEELYSPNGNRSNNNNNNERELVVIKTVNLMFNERRGAGVGVGNRRLLYKDPIKDIDRMYQLGDDYHVLGYIEALRTTTSSSSSQNLIHLIMPRLHPLKPYCIDVNVLTKTVQYSNSSLPRLLHEIEARVIFQQLMESLTYIHEQHHICHRNISMECILIHNDIGRVVLHDFSLSCTIPIAAASGNDMEMMNMMNNEPELYGLCNSSYVPPEIWFSNKYNCKSFDLWSCVIVLFELLTGQHMYMRPDKNCDPWYEYLIYCGGISTTPWNERMEELVTRQQRQRRPGPGPVIANSKDNGSSSEESSSDYYHTQMKKIIQVEERIIHKWNIELLELFENILCVEPQNRWSVQDVMNCTWMKMEL